MITRKRLFIFFCLFALSMLLSGCGLFGPEADKTAQPIDPPPADMAENGGTAVVGVNTQDGSIVVVPEGNQAQNGQESTATFTGQLYLLDANRHVVPVTMDIPKVEDIAQQVLRYMVKGGPVEPVLPEGFSAILPEGTKVLGMTIKEGVATVDFSPHFTNYAAEDEQKIVEAITWALTQFTTVNTVKIWVNGYPQEVMPVNGTPISSLSRENGINIELANNIDIGKTSKVTLYFMSETEELDYFVPVTRIIPKSADIAEATLAELIKGPKQGSGLFSALLPSTRVLEAKISESMIVANFDDSLLGFEPGKASPDVIHSIVLSLTENTGIEQVQVQVNGENNVLAGNLDLSKPVTRPAALNAYRF